VVVLLATPAFIPLLNSIIVAHQRSLIATGFIQYDQPAYVAIAREYFDQGFHFFYNNPYADYDMPRIYFQPHLFLLGFLQQLGIDPGALWVAFSGVGTLFAAFVAVRFYGEVIGLRGPAEKLGLLCFFWGGGVAALIGFVHALVIGKVTVAAIFQFDPGRGWWVLNFGRNLVYGPTEAYYHGVFLLCMLFLVQRRFGLAIALAALLSLSHPYTGIELSLIVVAYLLIERLNGDRSVTLFHLAGSNAVFCFHVWYYLFFLNRFADHRAVQSQIELIGITESWFYPPRTFIPALLIVGVLAIARLWRWPGFRQVVRDPKNRLFLVWFIVVFGITQHYHFMRPIEPIHFARGYDWTALFFLGAPLLVSLLERLLRANIKIPAMRLLPILAFLAFMLSDNLIWFASFMRPSASKAVLVTTQQREVLNWLARSAEPRDMVVTADPTLGYLVSTYTRVRSWAGHPLNTPHFEQRALESRQAFQDEILLPAWSQMRVFYVQRRQVDLRWRHPARSMEVFRNADYSIWDSPGLNPSLEPRNPRPMR
jgi:hypothetical protein